jgi:hypothetical protein
MDRAEIVSRDVSIRFSPKSGATDDDCARSIKANEAINTAHGEWECKINNNKQSRAPADDDKDTIAFKRSLTFQPPAATNSDWRKKNSKPQIPKRFAGFLALSISKIYFPIVN